VPLDVLCSRARISNEMCSIISKSTRTLPAKVARVVYASESGSNRLLTYGNWYWCVKYSFFSPLLMSKVVIMTSLSALGHIYV
jgi:hypothetical protein